MSVQPTKTCAVKVGDKIESTSGFPGKVLTVSQTYWNGSEWQMVLQDKGVDFCRVSERELLQAVIEGRVTRA